MAHNIEILVKKPTRGDIANQIFLFPTFCSVSLMFGIMGKNLASNREKSEDFDAYRSQRPITKTYVIFKIVIEIYQEQDAFMTLAGVLFALWAEN